MSTRQPATLTHPETMAEYPAPPGADITTCGTCHRSWDNSLITSVTPAPAARCPFEYEHEHEPPEGECTEAETIIGATAAVKGWTPEDCIRLLCEFVEDQELTDELYAFVSAQR